MLDHVERRRILEQPAGEDSLPAQRLIGIGPLLHQHLHESARFGRPFPRRGAFARSELDDDIVDPFGFARLKQKILRQIVALVEHTDLRHPFRHRRADFRHSELGFPGELPGQFLGQFGFDFFRSFSRFLGAGSQKPRYRKQRQHSCPQRRPETPHDQESGVQAS